MRIRACLPVAALALALALAACESVKAEPPDAAPTCPTCDPHATCEGTTCVCSTGWSGSGETCSDVNECLTNNGGCDQNADCTNTDGSRDCACKSGFVGNGFACQPVWVMVGSSPGLDIDPENFGTKAAGVGNLILFGPEANNLGAPFMRAFNTSTNVVSPPLALPPETQTDFCACGFTDVFLAAGGLLYMLGNNGDRYLPGNNSWSTIPSYVDPFRRGEAGGAVDPQRNAIYLVGGRSNETTAIQMDLGMLGFASLPGTVPFPVDQGRAWVFSGDHRLYVTDGFGADRKRLASYDPSDPTGTWTALPDAPGDLGAPAGMGEYQDRLWVTTEGRMYFFHPATGQWDVSVVVPPGTKAATVVGADTYVLVKGAGGLEIYRLAAIE